jgi:hypothetical protein
LSIASGYYNNQGDVVVNPLLFQSCFVVPLWGKLRNVATQKGTFKNHV